MTGSKCLLLVVIIGIMTNLAGCTRNEFDSSYYAQKYCDCLNENNPKSDFFDARTKCDGELLSQNRYYRFYYIETYYGRYSFVFPESFRDSVAEFNLQFNRYIEKNCCKVAIEGCDKDDSMQIKRVLIDSTENYK